MDATVTPIGRLPRRSYRTGQSRILVASLTLPSWVRSTPIGPEDWSCCAYILVCLENQADPDDLFRRAEKLPLGNAPGLGNRIAAGWQSRTAGMDMLTPARSAGSACSILWARVMAAMDALEAARDADCDHRRRIVADRPGRISARLVATLIRLVRRLTPGRPYSARTIETADLSPARRRSNRKGWRRFTMTWFDPGRRSWPEVKGIGWALHWTITDEVALIRLQAHDGARGTADRLSHAIQPEPEPTRGPRHPPDLVNRIDARIGSSQRRQSGSPGRPRPALT